MGVEDVEEMGADERCRLRDEGGVPCCVGTGELERRWGGRSVSGLAGLLLARCGWGGNRKG